MRAHFDSLTLAQCKHFLLLFVQCKTQASEVKYPELVEGLYCLYDLVCVYRRETSPETWE